MDLDTPELPVVNSKRSNKILMSGKGRKIFMDDLIAYISCMCIAPFGGGDSYALSECAC